MVPKESERFQPREGKGRVQLDMGARRSRA